MENGYWIHTAPIGYRYQTIKGRGKMLMPNPPFDAVVKEAFEGFASGRFATQAEVKRFFETIPDFPRNGKGEIKQKRVVDILTQPVYAGYIRSERYGISWLKAQHEPLVSLATFEKVQERRQGATYAPRRKNIGADFALRGFATCACCGSTLMSSWSKGKSKHYAYYLCQTKGCEAYGKSIPRDKIENEVGELIKALEPTPGLIHVMTAMFKDAWSQRSDQAKHAIQEARRRIASIDKEIDQILARIMEASNSAVIRAYEDKVAKLERDKALMVETLTKQAPSKGTMTTNLEHCLQFLANPWKIWESGQINARRLVLKLAFQAPIEYHQNEGPRTPLLSNAFKALRVFSMGEVKGGAAGEN